MVRYPQPRKIRRNPLPHRRWHLFIASNTGLQVQKASDWSRYPGTKRRYASLRFIYELSESHPLVPSAQNTYHVTYLKGHVRSWGWQQIIPADVRVTPKTP